MAALETGTGQQRVEYLDAACAGDQLLRARVEALLKAHDDPTSFMGTPVAATLDETQAAQPGSGPDAAADSESISLEETLAKLKPYLQPSQRAGALGRLAHYDVLEILGRGAFGVVLRAFDDKLHRVVAIKTLAPELSAMGTARQRFLREARAVAAIRHENVIGIHAVDEQPLPFLVMECIDVQTLQQKIDAQGPLEVQEILRIGYQMACGLAAAHAQGQIHRDIKPANILLENSVERVKISDFGLARTVDDASLSQSGLIFGTPLYMAPEQGLNQPIDHRADLFSLGSTLFAMCTGRPPFRGTSTIGVLQRVINDQPRPIRDVNPAIPEWLCDVINRLHAKRPEERFQTAAEVAELLGQYLAQLQQPGGPKTLPFADGARRTDSVARRNALRRLAAAAIALLVAMAVLGTTEVTGVTKLTGSVIRIVTGEGTLVIEVDDPTVQIALDGEVLTIKGGGVEQVRLRPGQYQFTATKDGRPLKQELVSITRGGEKVVTISRENVPSAPVTATSKVESGAFVILGGKDVPERKLDTLAEAVRGASDGDTVEIRGNGPFDSQPIRIVGRGIAIRAGRAYRPVIRLMQDALSDGASLFVTDAPLVLEGLELQFVEGRKERRGRGPVAVHSSGATFSMANCTLTGADSLFQLDQSRRCELRNCLLLQTASLLNWSLPGEKGELVMENCLHGGYGGINLYTFHHNPHEFSLRVRNTTAVSQYKLFSLMLDRPVDQSAQPIRVQASENVFDTGDLLTLNQRTGPNSPGPLLGAAEAQALAPRLFDWHGTRNVFSVHRHLALNTGEFGKESLPLSTPIKSLQDWRDFLNAEETDSLEGQPRYQGGPLLDRIRSAVVHLTPDDFRLRAGSLGYRAGPDGKDLGADIDFVGPGAAYERWKQTTEYQEWLKETGQLK
jgi:hypothetical protein